MVIGVFLFSGNKQNGGFRVGLFMKEVETEWKTTVDAAPKLTGYT
jgi:hypothetical protein